jgi:hypothetical protein
MISQAIEKEIHDWSVELSEIDEHLEPACFSDDQTYWVSSYITLSFLNFSIDNDVDSMALCLTLEQLRDDFVGRLHALYRFDANYLYKIHLAAVKYMDTVGLLEWGLLNGEPVLMLAKGDRRRRTKRQRQAIATWKELIASKLSPLEFNRKRLELSLTESCC